MMGHGELASTAGLQDVGSLAATVAAWWTVHRPPLSGIPPPVLYDDLAAYQPSTNFLHSLHITEIMKKIH